MGDFTPFSCLLFGRVGERGGGQGWDCRDSLDLGSCTCCCLVSGQGPTCKVAPDIIFSSPVCAGNLPSMLLLGRTRRQEQVKAAAPSADSGCRREAEPGRVPGLRPSSACAQLTASIARVGTPCQKSCLANTQKGSFALQQKEMNKQEIRG